jgi:pilus assembly protein Flp/PilA
MTSLVRAALRFGDLYRRDDGASMVEYALLIALIAVAVVSAVTVLGRNTSTGLANAAANVIAS